MIPKKFWDEENVAKLRAAWESGGSAAAQIAFPDKTPKALEQAAYTYKIKRISESAEASPCSPNKPKTSPATNTLEARVAAIEERLGIVPTNGVVANVVAPVVASVPDKAPHLTKDEIAPPPPGRQAALRPGPCDTGESEFIRRRVAFTVHQLSSELKRTQDAVRSSMRTVLASEK